MFRRTGQDGRSPAYRRPRSSAATEAAVVVTDLAMRTCGGAAFGGAHGIERLFRDARAPIVMAPTSDQAYEFIGRALCGLEVF